jgi:glycerol-3-phosphate acyltransferase PlsY
MLEAIIKFIAAYLLGTVMGGHIVGALRGGVDLRTIGSGNVGATNALRTQGKAFALGVLALDVGKGVAAVLLLPMLTWPWPQEQTIPRDVQAYLCGVAVALGHCYPVFYRFQGGKGVATLAGVFACLMTFALPFMLGAFIFAILLTGYVAVASCSAAATALAYAAFFSAQGPLSALGAFTLAMAALVFWKHRGNLQRIARGEEHRFERARILGRWLGR